MIAAEKTGEERRPAAQKEKYIPKTGVFGDAVDYTVYPLSVKERITGFALGMMGGFVAMYIVYDSPIAGLILGTITGLLAVPVYQRYLLGKRRDMLLTQFRDLLESITASLRTGRNTRNSFSDAKTDLTAQYGPGADIVREVDTILLGVNNGYSEEEMLADFAGRSGIEDVHTFALIFGAVHHAGSDISQIMEQTHDIISQKMSVEMEIQTSITETKNQMNILAIMPFVIILLLRYLGNADIVNNTPLNVIVKTISLFIFAGSYWMGTRIADIKV